VKEGDKLSGEVLLWDAQTGELKSAPVSLTVPVSTVRFSPDGKTLALGGGSEADVQGGGKTAGEIRLYPLESLIAKPE
jgi:WD40 repeat protein